MQEAMNEQNNEQRDEEEPVELMNTSWAGLLPADVDPNTRGEEWANVKVAALTECTPCVALVVLPKKSDAIETIWKIRPGVGDAEIVELERELLHERAKNTHNRAKIRDLRFNFNAEREARLTKQEEVDVMQTMLMDRDVPFDIIRAEVERRRPHAQIVARRRWA
ncbi:hypothetical protein EMMF5_006582 [Cystobasidiomycetes sp. EMM_F5]